MRHGSCRSGSTAIDPKDSRPAAFLCDEYHSFATVGESDPSGDEKFFALSRQAKCVAIVATQSTESLRSALAGEGGWRTLMQTFRSKVFLTLSDDASAKIASDLCGTEQQVFPQVSISESGHDATVSALSGGRALAGKAALTVNKNFSMQFRPLFPAKRFLDLGNAQAIATVYDGRNPLPPTYLYLKPHFADPNLTWFEQRAKGIV